MFKKTQFDAQKIISNRPVQLGALLIAIAAINALAGNVWIAAVSLWIVPILTMLYWHQTRLWRGLPLLFLVHWIPVSILWQGMTPFFGPAHHIFMAFNTLIAMVPYIIDRWLVMRTGSAGQRPFLTTLIFPAAAVTLEFLTVFGSPLGTFGAAGYTQFVFPALTQIVAVTGLLGITFLTGWIASTVVWAWENRAQQRVGPGLALTGGLLLIVLAYGSGRLLFNRAPSVAENVRIVGLTAAEWQPQELFPLLEQDEAAFRATTQEFHASYLQQTAEAVARGAQLVVWPEGAIIGVADDVQATVQQAQTLAREKEIYLALPTFEFYPDQERAAENRMLIVDPQGEIVLNHVKYGGNFIEGTLPGNKELQTVETPFGTLSAVICWDADFPDIIRQAGQADVDLLLITARDWSEIADMHGEMATFRGIENGLTIVRQADQGLSLVSDPYGRVLTSANHFEPDGKLIDHSLAVRATSTLYARTGDWLGWLALAGLVVLTAWSLLIGRQRVAKAAPKLVVDN